MQATIEVSGLRKRFGPALALDGMTFTVQPGRVTGFVGPNGAGKSTTMRVILRLDAPDAGTALVAGKPYASIRRPMNLIGSIRRLVNRSTATSSHLSILICLSPLKRRC